MTDIVNWAKLTLGLGRIESIVVILAVGAVLLFLRPRWGRRWIVAAVIGYWFVSSPFGSNLLVAPLVRGFHAIEDPREAQSVEAIVVLGGGIHDLKVRSDTLVYPSELTALRVIEGARVFRLLEGRPSVVASGGITVEGQQTSEGVVIADALSKLGVPRDRIVVEQEAQTTHEQAIFVTRLLKGRGIGRFVLVTSPTHMSRSVAVFRAQGADVVPSLSALTPERLRRPLFFTPNGDSLGVSDAAVYDYAACIYYWGRGWFRPVSAAAGP